MYPVYLITNCTNFKAYVGCVLTTGKSVQARFREHCKGKGSAPYLWNAINRYGVEAFTVQQIDAGNTPEQALELERWWIKRLGVKKSGYNLSDGGRGSYGCPTSKLQKQIASEVGKIQGRKNVTSGLLAALRTPDHQRSAGIKGGSSRSEKKIQHLRRIASLGGTVAKQSGQAASIAHIRWHVNRGVVKPGCGLCQ